MIAAIWASIEFWAMLSGWVQAVGIIITLWLAYRQVKTAVGQIEITRAEGRTSRTIALIEKYQRDKIIDAAQRLREITPDGYAAADAKNYEHIQAYRAARDAGTVPDAAAQQVLTDYLASKNFVAEAKNYIEKDLLDSALFFTSLGLDMVSIYLTTGKIMAELSASDYAEFQTFASACQKFFRDRGDVNDPGLIDTQL